MFNNNDVIYKLNNKEINKISISDGKIVVKKNIILNNIITLNYTNTIGIIEYYTNCICIIKSYNII